VRGWISYAIDGRVVISTAGANQPVTFTSRVDGAQALVVNAGSATTTFNGVVGGTTALLSLTTDAGGTTQINGGGVTTSGAQSYNDAVVLGANATFTTTLQAQFNSRRTFRGL
jgi:hypothetical protein